MLEAAFLTGSYIVMSAGLSVTVARFSPSIGPRLRHLFTGAAPLAAVLATKLDGKPSVAINSYDLLAAGGLLAAGIATSIGVTRIVAARGGEARRLPSS